MSITKMNEAKATKWLDTLIQDSVHGVLTRRALLTRELVGKHKSEELYAKRRVCWTYKVEYWLNMAGDGYSYVLKCPKYVFDFVIAAEL